MSVFFGGLCSESGTIGFDGGFHRFTGFAGAFLNAAQQFILPAFDELEIVIGECGPFLFEAAFDDVPVAFDFECCHRGDSRAKQWWRPWGVTLLQSKAA